MNDKTEEEAEKKTKKIEENKVSIITFHISYPYIRFPNPQLFERIFPKILKKISISVLSFTSIHLIALKTIKFLVANNEKRLVKIKPNDWYYIPERFSSMTHGLLASVAAFYYVFIKKTWKGDTVNPYPESLDNLFSMSAGYEIYDLILMILHGNEPISMWLHHLIVLSGTCFMMFYRIAPFYPVVFGITEATVIPHNIYTLLSQFSFDLNGYPEIYLTGARVVAHFLFRIFIAPFAFWYAKKNNMNKEEFKKLPGLVSGASLFNMLTLGFLNVVWTIAEAKKFVRKLKRRI